MAINVVLGVVAAAVPFIFSKLATGPGSSGGWFRTHTTKPGAAIPPAPPLVRNAPEPGLFTEEQIFGPPVVAKPITPAPAQESAKAPATPAPQPMPTPPPMDLAMQQEAPAQLPPAPIPAPVQSSQPWLGPNQTQLPTVRDIEALPPPPAPPAPPPFPVVAPTPASVTPSVTEERPPQERGELPADLQALPDAMPTNTPPAGYDPVKAKSLAKQVAANIVNRGNNYSREMLKQFQNFAGIDVDGVYGGQSRGALEFFGVRRPPPALFKPTTTEPYRWASWSQ